ncbi:hypothetical protein CYMTET_3733, partial [Cymbomonas tetramitiformis]
MHVAPRRLPCTFRTLSSHRSFSQRALPRREPHPTITEFSARHLNASFRTCVSLRRKRHEQLQKHAETIARPHSFQTYALVAEKDSPEASSVSSRNAVRTEVAKLFAKAIEQVFPGQELAPIISPCNNPKFGDYQCNNAMPLFATFKGKEDAPFKNPREIATAILDALPDSPLISETSIAGPGFINARVSSEWLSQELQGLLRNGSSSWAPPIPQDREKVIVDFSSPNIAKEMHVGHLRSTIIGDTICRLLEFSGAEVLRLNHVGDWGTQFGMLIEFLKEETGGSPENASKAVGDLQAFYKKAKAKFDEDEDFKLRAQKAVVQLQGGDPESLALWQGICDVSRREFDSLYKRLGVELEERGESYYNPLIPEVLAELKANKVSILSDGAMCVFPKGKDGEIDTDSTPLIVQKSDGGFNYASTDLTAIKQRLFTEDADWIIYVTDVGQQSHFKMVFETAERAGWLAADARAGRGAPRIDHVGFGLVLGDDGKRFRTRSGEVVSCPFCTPLPLSASARWKSSRAVHVPSPCSGTWNCESAVHSK